MPLQWTKHDKVPSRAPFHLLKPGKVPSRVLFQGTKGHKGLFLPLPLKRPESASASSCSETLQVTNWSERARPLGSAGDSTIMGTTS